MIDEIRENSYISGDFAEQESAMPETRLLDPVTSRIHTVRGHKVRLDSDLAEVYGVETGALNRAVKRNRERFPNSFIFQLLEDEWEALIRWSGQHSTMYAVMNGSGLANLRILKRSL